MNAFVIVAAMIGATAQATPNGDDKTIVVTAKTLAQTERALSECLARQCPPREDINASINHAENQFLSGDYSAARKTLARSRSRNGKFAKEFPVDVADLHRAYGRLSNHDGFSRSSLLAQISSLETLKEGQPDHALEKVLQQRAMVGDEFARAGRLVAANDIYRRVEREAEAAGLSKVRGYVMLRGATLYASAATLDPAYTLSARERIDRIEATTDPALAPFRAAVPILRSYLSAKTPVARREAVSQAARIVVAPTDRPVLLYAPTVEYTQTRSYGPFAISPKSAPKNAQWIDVSFLLRADGSVDDVDILRQSEEVERGWPDEVLKAIALRRYAPLKLAGDNPGLVRVERFSLVQDMRATSRTRVQTRQGNGRLVSLDITDDANVPEEALRAAPAVGTIIPPDTSVNSR